MHSVPYARDVQQPSTRETLRELGNRYDLRIGTCVDGYALRISQYAETVMREFSVITSENALKFGKLSHERGAYDFSAADSFVAFAEARDLEVRGHVLIWGYQLPKWLTDSQLSPEDVADVFTTHIKTVVGRYRGRIATWDVVNEAINADGSFTDNIWYRAMGAEYVDIAFQAARAADPDALLFYNDLGVEATPEQSVGMFRLLQGLRDRGRPIDGVGLQMHLELRHRSAVRQLSKELVRLAELGLRTHVTELDVRIQLSNATATPAELETQAEIYRAVLRACLETPSCDTLILWGVSDRFSWIPHFFRGSGEALVLDAEYRPKPAYYAMISELHNRHL